VDGVEYCPRAGQFNEMACYYHKKLICYRWSRSVPIFCVSLCLARQGGAELEGISFEKGHDTLDLSMEGNCIGFSAKYVLFARNGRLGPAIRVGTKMAPLKACGMQRSRVSQKNCSSILILASFNRR